MTLTAARFVVSAVSTVVAVGAWTTLLSAQAAGLPDPARLPSRPGPSGPGPAPAAPPRDTSARGPAAPIGTAVLRGQVVYMLERSQIENRDALAIASELTAAFEKFCTAPTTA